MKKLFALLSIVTMVLLATDAFVVAFAQTIISEDMAKEIAYDQSGTGTVIEFKLENKPNGTAEYVIVIQNGFIRHENKIDAYTGMITGYIQRDETYGPVGPAGSAGIIQQQSSADIISADKAHNIALDRIGNGTVAQSKLEYHPDGRIEYKIIIVSGDDKYDIKVNAYNGTVRELKMDQITTVGPNVYSTTGTIGADSAKSIALEKAGSGVVVKCKLEYKPHEDIFMYKVDVVDGEMECKVELNAVTGSIIKYELKYKP